MESVENVTCPACGDESPEGHIHRCHWLHMIERETREIGTSKLSNGRAAPLLEVYYACRKCGLEFVPKEKA